MLSEIKLVKGLKSISSQVTTSEKKNGFLLIATFKKLFNTQNQGHQGSFLGGLPC
jgi:hypothetical protein